MRRSVDDSLIRLVWNEPIDLVRGVTGHLKGILDNIGDHRHRMAEHLATFHAQVAYGSGGRGAAVDIELRFVAAVGPQPDREHAAIVARTRLLLDIENHRARAVAEQDTGPAIAPIQNARESLGPDDQGSRKRAGSQQRVGGRESKNKPGAYRLQVERGAMSDAETGLNRNGACRKSVIR